MTNTYTGSNGDETSKFSVYFVPGLLTLLAGLSTGFGGIIAVYFLSKETNENKQKIQLGKWMSVAAAFMICVTCFELIPTIFQEKSRDIVNTDGSLPKEDNDSIDFFSFCFYSAVGALLVSIMKKLIPEVNLGSLVTDVYRYHETNLSHQNDGRIERKVEKENHHEVHQVLVLDNLISTERQHQGKQNEIKKLNALLRSSLLATLAICAHNFPEGIATMLSTLHGGK